MRVLSIVAVTALLCGCGANYAGSVSTGGFAPVAPVVPIVPIVPAAQGAAVVAAPAGLYASVTVSGSAASFLYWFAGAGILGAMVLDDLGHPGPFVSRMREDRTVVEVDCSRALPDGIVGNIRCK
jgi:hypothetical protein